MLVGRGVFTRTVEAALCGSAAVAATKDVLLADPLLGSLDYQISSGQLGSASDERVGLILGLDIVSDDGAVGSDGGVQVNIQRLREVGHDGFGRGDFILGAVISFANLSRRIRGRNTALIGS